MKDILFYKHDLALKAWHNVKIILKNYIVPDLFLVAALRHLLAINTIPWPFRFKYGIKVIATATCITECNLSWLATHRTFSLFYIFSFYLQYIIHKRNPFFCLKSWEWKKKHLKVRWKLLNLQTENQFGRPYDCRVQVNADEFHSNEKLQTETNYSRLI